MTHKRETCRLCGARTRRLFTHVVYSHPVDISMPGDYADLVTARMAEARGR